MSNLNKFHLSSVTKHAQSPLPAKHPILSSTDCHRLTLFFFGFLWLYPLVSIESIELFALQLPGGLGYGDIGNHVVVAENVLDTTRFAGV